MAAADLVSKPGARKSPVWEHFGFQADENGKPVDKDHPRCKLCSRAVATKGGNTSNLLSHLRNAHPAIFRRMKGGEGSSKPKEKATTTSGRQQMLEGAIAKATPYAWNSKRWERLTHAVTVCVAKDIRPLQLVYMFLVLRLPCTRPPSANVLHNARMTYSD